MRRAGDGGVEDDGADWQAWVDSIEEGRPSRASLALGHLLAAAVVVLLTSMAIDQDIPWALVEVGMTSLGLGVFIRTNPARSRRYLRRHPRTRSAAKAAYSIQHDAALAPPFLAAGVALVLAGAVLVVAV